MNDSVVWAEIMPNIKPGTVRDTGVCHHDGRKIMSCVYIDPDLGEMERMYSLQDVDGKIYVDFCAHLSAKSWASTVKSAQEFIKKEQESYEQEIAVEIRITEFLLGPRDVVDCLARLLNGDDDDDVTKATLTRIVARNLDLNLVPIWTVVWDDGQGACCAHGVHSAQGEAQKCVDPEHGDVVSALTPSALTIGKMLANAKRRMWC